MINYRNTPEYDCHGIPIGCADFVIKRHDTRPVFKVEVTDCENPIDLTNLVVEASMWCNAKLKNSITTTDIVISFADNIGFEQINLDTIIQVGDGRAFERMLVQSINEEAKTVTVYRAQMDTSAFNWKKGTKIRLLRFLNNPAIGELIYEDETKIDGTVVPNVLAKSILVYEWKSGDTCMTGKYFFEFKILSILYTDPVDIGSQISAINYHCDNGVGVQWVRRFPNDREGFLIEVFDSPTAE